MRRPRTLRARLTLGIAVLVLAVLAVVGLVVYYGVERRLSASLQHSLQTATVQAMAGASNENGRLVLGAGLEEGAGIGDLRVPGLAIAVLTPEGSTLRQAGPYQQIAPGPAALDAARRGVTTTEARLDPASGAHLRILTTPLAEDGKTLAVFRVTLSEEPMRATLRQLRLTLLALLVLAPAAATLLAYFLVRRTLRPLDRITRTAAEISSRDLSQRLGLPPGEDEVGRLAATFDAMLERLEGSFRRERQFVADASHELRTPLAAIQAIVSVTRGRKRDAADYERALDDVEIESGRLRTLVESLLELARGDAGGVAEMAPVDLSALLGDVCASMTHVAEAKGLTLRAEVAGGLAVVGDADALVRLFAGVLDNAVKYSDEGEITMVAGRPDDALVVVVSDSGRGIRSDQIEHVFDRFYRGDASRSTEGSGLGLAIARQIARAHGGDVSLDSGGVPGTTCTVHLPAS